MNLTLSLLVSFPIFFIISLALIKQINESKERPKLVRKQDKKSRKSKLSHIDSKLRELQKKCLDLTDKKINLMETVEHSLNSQLESLNTQIEKIENTINKKEISTDLTNSNGLIQPIKLNGSISSCIAIINENRTKIKIVGKT